MKKVRYILFLTVFCMILSACGTKNPSDTTADNSNNPVEILLSDEKITVDGKAVSSDVSSAVFAANDIVFYPEGKDFTFGEGEAKDSHSQEEADEHTVVHIAKPGEYILSGKLSSGQIAVDLGEKAQDDENAAVTLVLDGVDITSTVAPAVIFYNVYECGTKDTESASENADTQKAGAKVIIADDSHNTVNGSYVAEIYKSVELSEDGKEVLESKKLHKYDGAFYSKMSMNIYGQKNGTGTLNINAENEGLNSELHLTVFGGNININSGNDGINTNEDDLSVTTINGGTLNITVSGSTGEGDGIDSNGWVVINGGAVNAYACAKSADSGIDADKGILLNGGRVVATGNMIDRMKGSLNYAVFNFMQNQTGGELYSIKNDKTQIDASAVNDFQSLVIADKALEEGEYSIYKGKNKLEVGQAGGFDRPGSGEMPPRMPENGEPPEKPENARVEFDGEKPERNPDNVQKKPDGAPDFQRQNAPWKNDVNMAIEFKDTFKIENGANFFIVSETQNNSERA